MKKKIWATPFYAISVNKYFQILATSHNFDKKLIFLNFITSKKLHMKNVKTRERTKNSGKKPMVWEALAPYVSPSDVKKSLDVL